MRLRSIVQQGFDILEGCIDNGWIRLHCSTGRLGLSGPGTRGRDQNHTATFRAWEDLADQV